MATATATSTPLLNQARDTLSQLQTLQSDHALSIIRLSEPITSSHTNAQSATTTAAAADTSASLSRSLNADPSTHPSTLSADLSHYRDLFTKLHFSYIEQVTKEKYLRAIVGDPPLLHTHQENVALETDVLEMKRQLKAKKVQSEEMVEAIRAEAAELVSRWEDVVRGTERAAVLEQTVAEGEDRVAQLRELVRSVESEVMRLDDEILRHQDGQQQHNNNDDRLMKLGLQDTLAMIERRETEMKELEARINGLEKQVPVRTRECEIVERDLEALEKRKNVATAEASEARRRKELGEDGGRDEVGERGRWYRSQEQVFRGLGLVEG